MIILSIESATPVCSVALHRSGQLLALSELHSEKSHSEQLTIMIGHVLAQTGISMQDLAAVAVSKGPGSYTGLRIGVATAKGLCFALDKPLLSVNTLEAMTRQITPFYSAQTLFCPMIDARRMEVYCLISSQDGANISDTEAKIIHENSFEKYLDTQRIVFFGNGASKCKALLTDANAVFLENIYPTAQTVGFLAFEAYQQHKFENLTYFEPFYLKDFVGK